jgi:hypothetical protein
VQVASATSAAPLQVSLVRLNREAWAPLMPSVPSCRAWAPPPALVSVTVCAGTGSVDPSITLPKSMLLWIETRPSIGCDGFQSFPWTLNRSVSTTLTPGPPTAGPSTRKKFVPVGLPMTWCGTFGSPVYPSGVAGPTEGSQRR